MRLTIGDQKRYAFWFGVVFIFLSFLMLVIIFLLGIDRNERVFALFEFFFRTTLSLAAAGVAAMLPGFFEVDWSRRLGVRAVGAFGVFLLVFLTNPPKIAAEISEEQVAINLYNRCTTGLVWGQTPSAQARNACTTLGSLQPKNPLAQLGLARLKYADRDYEASLKYSIAASGLFFAYNGISIFDALIDSRIDTSTRSDAEDIAGAMERVLWGLEGYKMAKIIADYRTEGGFVQQNMTALNLKFYLINSLALAYDRELGIDEMSNSEDEESLLLFEKLYDACILSWKAAMSLDKKLMDQAISIYENFRSELFKSIGANRPAQERYLDCLARFSMECETLPGFPRYCPLFDFI